MSNEETQLPFSTTANKEEAPVEVDTSPEGLKKLVEDGTPQVLKLINQNRKESVDALRRKIESLEGELVAVRNCLAAGKDPGSLMVIHDDSGEMIFSLENTLRNIQQSLDSVQTFEEATNSLVDMLINDIVGMVHNLNNLQTATIVSNGQCQTLIQLMLDKGMITEPEMKATWESLIQNKKEQMKMQAEQTKE